MQETILVRRLLTYYCTHAEIKNEIEKSKTLS